MSSNDVILLSDMLRQFRRETAGILSEADHDTYFTAKQYLRPLNPTNDDILSGLVDGEQDGGIDAVYIFVNGYCIRDDAPLSNLGRNAKLDLVIFQVKNSKGFGESAIEKLALNLPKLLEFERDEEQLSKFFNPRVLEITRRFLATYRSLIMPELCIYTCFASLKADFVHPNVVEKSTLIEDALRNSFSACEPSTLFLDAAKVADLARERAVVTRNLALAEIPISTDTAGGYIGVVRLKEYERFITDDSGKLDSTLFEANVRDYEGETSVNRSINQTLEHLDPDVDFWWLNNGVTIVANRVQPANKMLELESPQIVNGLQTSHEIYKRGRTSDDADETRSVLVKVIQAKDDKVRDRIIRATNSQTALGPSSLRATDKVQRQIEEHLLTQGLYYERRRNQYSNQGIPVDKLVSIEQMSQAVLSSLARLPHVARGQISRVFEPDIYDLLFDRKRPIYMYSTIISVHRSSEQFLRSDPSIRDLSEDFIFHLTMMTTIALTRKNEPTAADIAAIDVTPSPMLLSDMLRIIRDEFAAGARRRSETLLDRVAKDGETTTQLLVRARRYLLASPKQ